MIRQALPSDIDSIIAVVEGSRKIMQADGNFQWDENYPLRKHFERDIKDGTLYIIDENGRASGVICLNADEPKEYAEASWQGNKSSIVIHRMAISPDRRGCGFAAALLGFACEHAKENKASSIKTDTFSGNIPMNTLFLKHGFVRTGIIELEGKKQQPFYCYEKVLG